MEIITNFQYVLFHFRNSALDPEVLDDLHKKVVSSVINLSRATVQLVTAPMNEERAKRLIESKKEVEGVIHRIIETRDIQKSEELALMLKVI